uniref:C2h2-type zn-finger protein n=1 Tax=Culex tarsalis TaxID=7177 RepID=A0A1Q3F909_CULTA
MDFYATICRLCEASDKLSEKWLDPFADGNESLLGKIRSCTSVELSPSDALPKRICVRCQKSLDQAHSFRLQCAITDAKLRHEIGFLEQNHWNPQLTIPPFFPQDVKVEQQLVTRTTGTESPRLTESMFIKAEQPEEEEEDEQEFVPSKVEIEWQSEEEVLDDRDESFSDKSDEEEQEDDSHSDEDRREPRKTKPQSTICETCGEQFERPALMHAHVREVHGKKRYTCSICSKTFARKSRWADHEAQHAGLRQFECQQCDKKYTTQQGLKTHTEDVHSEHLPYVCDKCGKGFSKEGRLRHHYSMHIESRNFVCGVCAKGFKTQAHLNLHANTHLPQDEKKKRKRRNRQKTCICPFCGKVSNSVGTHDMHVRTHTGEQRYECHICGKRFTSSGSHKKHLRVHSGEKPFVCEYCQKPFRQKHHMTTHIRGVHTNEKPYQCRFCSRGFATRGNMQLHERSHGAGGGGGGGGGPADAMANAVAGLKQELVSVPGSMEVSMTGSNSPQHASPLVTEAPSPMMNPGVMMHVHQQQQQDMYFHSQTP